MLKSLTTSVSYVAVLAIIALLDAIPAHALIAKSWVSSFGNDNNPCTRALPCATFQGALGRTSAGGEIGVVDAGDYGQFQTLQSVSLTNDGSGEASILAGGGNGVGISIIAGAGDVISVRGLIIDGQGTGTAGMDVYTASALHIQRCVIRNFENAIFGIGLRLELTTNMQVFVSDTLIYNNGSGANSGGILVEAGAPNYKIVLNRVQLENNVFGLKADGHFTSGGTMRIVMRDSVVSGNAGGGIIATTSAGAAGVLFFVERSSFVNNAGAGILASGPRATILLDGNVITGNGTGISAVNSGQLISYGNNKNNNNLGPEGAPTGFFNQM